MNSLYKSYEKKASKTKYFIWGHKFYETGGWLKGGEGREKPF